jgi:hypothetical protein
MLVLPLLWLLLRLKLHRNRQAMLAQELLVRLRNLAPSILPQNLLKSETLLRCIFLKSTTCSESSIVHLLILPELSLLLKMLFNGWLVKTLIVCASIISKLAGTHDNDITNPFHFWIEYIGSYEDLLRNKVVSSLVWLRWVINLARFEFKSETFWWLFYLYSYFMWRIVFACLIVCRWEVRHGGQRWWSWQE